MKNNLNSSRLQVHICPKLWFKLSLLLGSTLSSQCLCVCVCGASCYRDMRKAMCPVQSFNSRVSIESSTTGSCEE